MNITRYARETGGFPKLAKELGLNPEFLRQIAKGRRRASAKTAIAIEHATAGAVTREELRPDIFAAPRVRAHD